jgi:alcohol dehydrogenase
MFHSSSSSPRDVAPVAVPGSRVKLVFAPGSLGRLGEYVRAEGGSRVLLVTDPGIRDAGHAERAVRAMYNAGLVVRVFDEVQENPTTDVVYKALRVAREARPDFIVGLGGGSSMDCAKGVNFVYTNGGRMQDYWGTGKATEPMLPLIAIPTTAGTGSEAQSYALITDPETHQKMACGDEKATPKLAILDAELTATQPVRVAAATGIDAVAHALETAVCKRRNVTSIHFSGEAWRRLDAAYERVLAEPTDDAARADMLLGAHCAGCAIENSMLGIAHALANPLTGHFGVVHGFAVGMMLPHVIRFNGQDPATAAAYKEALGLPAEKLARRVEQLLAAGQIRTRLSEHEVPADDLPKLAAEAAKQWTATFNPRPVGEAQLLSLYRAAM